MTVDELKWLIKDYDDDVEVYIAVGFVQKELEQVTTNDDHSITLSD